MYSIENRCHRTGKYTVCRRVCASLSPESLQAGAVKGLSQPETVIFYNFASLGHARTVRIWAGCPMTYFWQMNTEYRIFIVYVCGHRNLSIDCLQLQHNT